jgi:PAS domain S-box-containing protein
MQTMLGEIQRLWRWLTRPSPSVRQADKQSQSQMLAALLIVIAPVGVLMSLLRFHPIAREMVGEPELNLALMLGLFAFIPYLMNRAGYMQQAIRLTVYVSALAIFLTAVPPDNPQATNSLLRLLIPILFGSIFLPLREQAAFVAVVLLAMLALPLFAAHITLLEILAGPFGFVLVISLLIMVLSMHRSRLEAVRQAHLRSMELRSRRILEAAFDATLIHRDGRVLEAGPDFTKLFGYELSSELTFKSLIAEERQSRVRHDARLCDTVMRKQDGSTFFAELVTIQHDYPDGPAEVTVVRDVSRARRVEEALRESERRFRLLTESLPDFIYIWEAGTDRVPYFNRDGFLGYTHEELAIPGSLTSATHPDDWQTLQNHWQTVLRGDELSIARAVEYRTRHKQGHWEWLERWDSVLTRDTDSQPQQVLIVLRIISERKRAEEDLRYSEARNRALLEAIPDWAIHIDRYGNFIQVWPSKVQPAYLTAEEASEPTDALSGINVLERVPPEVAQAAVADVQRTLDSGKVQVAEYHIPFRGITVAYEAYWAACGPDEAIGIVRDITGRKQQEDRLRREASIFQNVFESIIITRLVEGRFIIESMNQAAQRLYGWQESEAQGQWYDDIIRVQPGSTNRSEFVKTLMSAGYWSGATVHLHRDGTPIHVLGSATLLRDDSGQPTGAVTIVLDITRREQIEAALRISEERFQTALKGSPIVVSNQDTSLRYTWIHNPALNFDPDTVLGKRDADLLERPEDAAQLAALKQQVIDSGVGLRRAVRWQIHGKMHHFDLTVEPLRSASGEIIGLTCAQVDITDRVREEEARQRIQHLLQTVIAHVPMVVWSVDRRGTITLAEGLGLRNMGMDAGDVIGRSAFSIFPQEPALLTDLQRALNGEALTSFSEINHVNYQTHYRPVFDAFGQVDGLVMVSIDISERIQAERHQLDLALERERINLLQRFMGDVSHDFKTPLTSIKLSAYLLSRVEDEAKRQRHTQVIEMQTARLEKLVTDLFTMSRLDQSITGEFDFGKVSINTLLRDMLLAHEPLIQQKQHTAAFEPKDDLAPFYGDAFQMERALTNILVNAINYTPEGGQIHVRAQQVENELVVEIEDNGIGIPAEEQGHIFTRFYRGDPARGSGQGGMGMGLAIARKIVEAHGGRIELESEPGKGSTFRVILPVLHTK